MAGEFLEIPLLIKRLSAHSDAIQDNSDKRESGTGFVAIAQGLGQESSTESLSLMIERYAQPRQNGDW